MILMNKVKMIVLFCALATGTLEARAQGAKIQLQHLEKLSAKAAETVDVSLDSQTLQVAAKFLRADRPDEAAIKDLLNGLKGVYVRVFQFDRSEDYAADLEVVRNQLRQPGWSRIVGVRSRRDGENVEVYTWLEGGDIAGLGIISSEARELVVVNIVGPIDLEKLSRLEGKFGIPRLDITGPAKRK
jgi:hypothetical protein